MEYSPTLVECLVTVGIWSFGLFLLTILIRVALPILKGELRYSD